MLCVAAMIWRQPLASNEETDLSVTQMQLFCIVVDFIRSFTYWNQPVQKWLP
jgi:hypothetical protein